MLEAYPPVARACAALQAAGAEHAMLSGSGSCVFALFETEAAARATEAPLDRDAFDAVFVVPLHHDDAWR